MTGGSLRARTPGSWELRVSLGNVAGRYRTLTRTVHGTRAQARRALAELAAEVEAQRAAGRQPCGACGGRGWTSEREEA